METHEMGQRVVVDAWGEDPMDALEHHMRREPQSFPAPDELGALDLVLRVRSAAVGWVDLLMSSGQYQHMSPPPYTPGLEFAGEVVWAGEGVKRHAIGDRILADGFTTGPRSSGDYQRWGGFATYAVIPERAAIAMPEGLGYDHAVNLLGNFETAYHALVHRGRVQPGEVVLVHGASGSTGLAAVQLAKSLGATVIATGRTRWKLESVASLGADHIVVTVDEDGEPRRFREDVKALTGGRGVDVVWDAVGGAVSLESLRCVRFGARFLIVGWASTPLVAKGRGGRGAPRANQLPTNLMMMKGLDVLGCPAVISTAHDPSLRPERLDWIMERVADGRLTPHVGEVFEMDDWKEAMEAKWRSRFVGGCVLRP